jgi:hypothetical protein
VFVVVSDIDPFRCWLCTEEMPEAPTLTYTTSAMGRVIWRRSGCGEAKGRVPS